MKAARVSENIITYPRKGALAPFLQGFLLSCEAEGKSEATITCYKDFIQRFISTARRLNIPQDPRRITRDHVRRYMVQLRQEGLSPSTTKDYLVALRLWFSWLMAEGIVRSNPCEGIKPPRPDRKVMRTLTPDEVKQLLDVARHQPERKALRDQLIILMLYDTGIRASELVGLNMEDVDLDKRVVFVRGKGRKERVLGLNGRTCVMAWRYVAVVRGEGPGPFIQARTGRRMLRTSLTQLLSKLARRAGWPPRSCSPHMLRRSFSVDYLRAGGDPFTLQILLGHERLEMSRHYAEALNAQDALKAHGQFSPAQRLFR
ncbi:MAG: tyrosine-type recombinase/integrase [Dehalococcoidia bacterium]